MLHPYIRIRQERYILLIILLPLLEEGGTLSLGEAMISGAGGGIGGKIYKWKRYELNSKTMYIWDKWSLNSQTIYMWNRYTYSKSYVDKSDPHLGGTCVLWRDAPIWRSFYIDQTTGYYVGTGSQDIILNWRGDASGWNYIDANIHRWALGERSASATGSRPYKYYYSNFTSTLTENKGTVASTVTSTSSNAYPANGASGSYWYESAGSYTSYSKGSTSYGQVESESSSAYPNNSYQGGYWYDNQTGRVDYSIGSYKDAVYSTSRNQYPDNGHDANYWYVYDGES